MSKYWAMVVLDLHSPHFLNDKFYAVGLLHGLTAIIGLITPYRADLVITFGRKDNKSCYYWAMVVLDLHSPHFLNDKFYAVGLLYGLTAINLEDIFLRYSECISRKSDI